MKNTIDNFSKQSKLYKKYRPKYPKELFDAILPLVKDKNQCWDCGTGNGQVAVEMSYHFTKIFATDISENQLKFAEQKPNIEYLKSRAEKTKFKDNQFDLITVAQAAHWFDMKAFCKEANRVSKNNGIICLWGYGLLKIEPKIDEIINEFYTKIIGPYWDKERKHIDEKYKNIFFDFPEINLIKNHSIRTFWRVDDLIGYLNTWSSVQKYMAHNNGKNPVDIIEKNLKKYWEKDIQKEIRFPIFMRAGIINK